MSNSLNFNVLSHIFWNFKCIYNSVKVRVWGYALQDNFHILRLRSLNDHFQNLVKVEDYIQNNVASTYYSERNSKQLKRYL